MENGGQNAAVESEKEPVGKWMDKKQDGLT